MSAVLKSPKVIALIVLVVGVIAVYAFVFLGGGAPPVTAAQETDAILREVPHRIVRALN